MTDVFKLLRREANKENAAELRRCNLNVNDYGLACFEAGKRYAEYQRNIETPPDDSGMMQLVD